MLTLNTTLDTLVLETRSTASTQYSVSYVDHTVTTFTANSTVGTVASIANTTITSAPAASTQREIKFLTLRNRSTTANTTVLIKRVVNGTNYVITPATSLRPGESLAYSKYTGFQVHNANGTPYCVSSVQQPVNSIQQPIFQSTDNLTTNKTLTSGSTFAVYIGKAPFSITGVRVSCNVTTAAATITWAEVALATGVPVLAGNPTLTPVGFTNIASIINTTGRKIIPIPVIAPNYVHEHDDLWLIYGNSATTAGILKAASVEDNVQSGFFASATSSNRPSITLGTTTAYTIQAATDNNILSLIEWT